MNSVSQTKEQIRSALKAMSTRDFLAATKELLDVLGYRSDRILELSGSVDEFIQEFQTKNQNTRTEQAFRKHVQSVQLIFQVTSDEISSANQPTLRFEIDSFDKGQQQSFMFFAVELKEATYARGQYAQFTREINKRLSQPSVVLFRTADNLLTLAFVHRRKHRRDQRRDVLGHVSLIREIDPTKSRRRVPLDILEDLSLERCLQWMYLHGKQPNFDGLLAAWLNTLDTEELNRRFYCELFGWFKRAVEEAKFPSTVPAEQQVIRLITRILFVWFIKEKGLVREDWFVCDKMKELLNDFGGSDYYRAILQNLFFATLNTEMDARGFSTRTEPSHRVFSRFRYQSLIRDTECFEDLMKQTPFINGGLFDCLDDEESRSAGGRRIDMFSDPDPSDGPKAAEARREAWRELNVPDALFFDKNQGLFPLLDRYKFTVEENTPIEQEVALDPELLGKVFENLLAAYNPETRETARKQTGSYYTPRDVVDYMVEEALVAALAEKAQPDDSDADSWQERLRHLLDYADAFNDVNDLFKKAEKEGIVQAIAEIKVLDPAVGSGAFPMSILHKLTLALQRIDPDNKRWEALQKERATQRAAAAFDTLNQQERDDELTEISDIFERYRDSDFGRKLYLIQNSIFGVDIQPVACQIAKLRFFISLAIEQKADETAENFGIKPLPNLETRFVAANTLLSLDKPLQMSLGQTDIVTRLEQELNENRERHFHATTRQQKLNCREKDVELREELATELEGAGFSTDTAGKISHWDAYDHNASANWFDTEYMFGIADGFDVVIGNPPYVRADSGDQHLELRQRIEDSNLYETLWEKWDLYVPFIERSYKLLKSGGFTTMIVSDAYCHSKYAQKSQEWFLQNSRILRLDFFSKIQIFDAAVRNITYLFQKADGSDQKPERRVHEPEFGVVNLLSTDVQDNLTYRVFFPEDTNFQQYSVPTVTLDEIFYITKGMVVHAHERKARGEFELKDLVSETKDKLHSKPFVEGKHLARWLPATNKWLEWGTERAPALFSRPTFPEIYKVSEKLISVDMAAGTEKLRVAYDDQRLYHNHSAWSFILWHSLSGVRNRSIKKQTRYRNERPRRSLPQREELEETSRRFAVKFLLGVMNSTAARDFLRANRRSNIHLYPDDWKKLPIPDVTLGQQVPIIELVDQILEIRRADPLADTDEQEAEIDRLIYELYGLTEEEISTVEGKP